jgi:hypothetical protein
MELMAHQSLRTSANLHIQTGHAERRLTDSVQAVTEEEVSGLDVDQLSAVRRSS